MSHFFIVITPAKDTDSSSNLFSVIAFEKVSTNSQKNPEIWQIRDITEGKV